MRAQSWSPPFNHNEAHANNGNFTSPYSPWYSPGTFNAPAPTATFSPPQTVPHQVTGGSFGIVFANGWPQREPLHNGRSFNAIHMAVIPKGPYQGMVLVFDQHSVTAGVNPPIPGIPTLTFPEIQSYQAYAIIDPADQPLHNIRYRNFLVPIGDPFPAGSYQGKNLFCAGHAWSPHGDLIIAGGTDVTVGGVFLGGNLVYVFNPRLDCWWPGTQTPYYPPAPGGPPGPFGPGSNPDDYVGLWAKADAPLVFPRWYPTATLTHRLTRIVQGQADKERMLISGGIEAVPTSTSPPNPNDMAQRSYEAMVILQEADGDPLSNPSKLIPDVAIGQLTLPTGVIPSQPNQAWDGPGLPAGSLHVDWLSEYPRCHLLSTGEIFFSGYAPRGAWLNHDLPGVWTQVANQPGQPLGTYSSGWNHIRHDGCAVLFPNLGGQYNIVMRLGGADEFTGPTTDSVESFAAGSGGAWTPAQPIPNFEGLPDGSRAFANAVILPTGGVLLVGGAWQQGPTIKQPLYKALLFENGTWESMGANVEPSRRTYHSTAVLLPDGRVFIGGGDDRDYDYEIFSPPYLDQPSNRPANPQWQTPIPPFNTNFRVLDIQRNVSYRVHFDPLPLGQTITEAVLMAPGSVTHHCDMSARYVELKSEVKSGHQLTFSCSDPETVVPRGIYMLFAVTNTSVSHAIWVRFLQ